MKFSRLIFANLFRKKVRLILTIGSFAVALFLFAFLAYFIPVRLVTARSAHRASATRRRWPRCARAAARPSPSSRSSSR